MNNTPFDQEFDYIVVGAGSAGCVLAARLSEDPSNRVAVIEAGGSERHPYITIPAAVGAAIMSPKFGWGLSTIPQDGLNGRQVPLPRGRVIGGSGSINGMAYFRGPARDFDDWATMGNPGWSYADLLPYFLRSEHNPEYRDSPYHAIGGPMGVSFPRSRNRLCDAFNSSMASLGFQELDDFNIPDPNGYGFRQGTIFNGKRVSTASAYLRPAMNRRNLTVVSKTLARKVLLDGKRAVGVEIETDGRIQSLCARKEVILACGSFHSPHLLLNSGIGDGGSLQEKGIEPLHQLPAVGRHLKDHPSTPIAMDMSNSTSYGVSWKATPRNLLQFCQYFLARSGPLSSNLFETNAYIKTTEAADRPDMQLVFQPARRNLKPFPIPIGHGYAIAVVCLYPNSEGSVTLSDANPSSAPLIDLSLGKDERDIEFLVKGLRLARKVFSQQAFQAYAARERDPGPSITDDQALADYVRKTLMTVHHPASSCRMGPAGDNVVDNELRVHGLAALRIADASIFPRLVGANTNAAVVAVAEKASDLILGKAAPTVKN